MKHASRIGRYSEQSFLFIFLKTDFMKTCILLFTLFLSGLLLSSFVLKELAPEGNSDPISNEKTENDFNEDIFTENDFSSCCEIQINSIDCISTSSGCEPSVSMQYRAYNPSVSYDIVVRVSDGFGSVWSFAYASSSTNCLTTFVQSVTIPNSVLTHGDTYTVSVDVADLNTGVSCSNDIDSFTYLQKCCF